MCYLFLTFSENEANEKINGDQGLKVNLLESLL